MAMLHDSKFVHARKWPFKFCSRAYSAAGCVCVRVRALEFAAVLRKCPKIN